MTFRTSRGSLATVSATLLAACGAPGPSLDEIRAATSKYESVDAALADGYTRDPLDTCETSYHLGLENVGTMGVHYLRGDLLGIDENGTRLDVTGKHDDFMQPGMLVYEPQPDSTLELVAIANAVNARAWEEAGRRGPPALGDVSFVYTPANPASGIPALYEMHVWLFRENPSGTFAPYNPAVSCEHHAFNVPLIIPDPTRAPHH